MTFGSLFSGVGGFDMGFEAAGMDVALQVEIDRQCRAVLRRHWPNADMYEDVSDVGSQTVSKPDDEGAPADGTRTAALAPVDLICGGFPCQDLSVAGRRAGLAGERSGLFYEFMRIVDELAPRWVVLENVPGLLSSNEGRDMGAVLGTLAELGYGYTYRVLDLQHFGVPQRRRRVFIVAHSGGVCPPEVLLEPEGLPWNPAPGEEAGEGAAGGVAEGAGGAFGLSENQRAEVRLTETHRQLTTGGGKPGQGYPAVFRPLDTTAGDPTRSDADAFVAHTLRAEGFDASEDGTGRGTPLVPDGGLPGICRNGSCALNICQRHGCQLAEPDALAAGAVTIPRRLTPTECERLMGWPDGHTAWGVNEDGEREDMADGPRYRMCGNGVGAPVAEWIGRRIMEADAAMREDADNAA